MHYLGNILQRNKMVDVVPIQRARIPICRFKDPGTGLKCDLTVNNRISISNSELIRCYMDLDPRVRDIVMIIKKWAKCRGINTPKEHTFSSYSYVLLCISFFQNIEPPILPNLQDPKAFPYLKMVKRKFDIPRKVLNFNEKGTFKLEIQYFNQSKKISKYFQTQNMMSRDELLIKIFKYYGQQYDYKRKVSSIRTNKGYLSENHFNNYFAVEDPFIHDRNTTSNVKSENIYHIINEFNRAYYILKSPNSKLEDIFKTDSRINKNLN
ncbi:PAP/OAS1 substrate-binding domain-containing protein [Anaeromyces robustus]|uniref:polynucleotide adenylyltransferase n=1 Tax=Anaeromyces robustus TaxID=1754192 RepID=A0A1Y1WP13_9FUNG|nr:PAP/OAS1 substrate-binding domain-containing protein [Anaeromyces robustus]|eukprot:ORX75232.1 PAP/OAS1 substrate-binding domain-containing protein [Anaeromyces robustus]